MSELAQTTTMTPDVFIAYESGSVVLACYPDRGAPLMTWMTPADAIRVGEQIIAAADSSNRH
jgi:hypothetical protein